MIFRLTTFTFLLFISAAANASYYYWLSQPFTGWICYSQRSSVGEARPATPEDFTHQGFVFAVHAEDVDDPFIQDAQNENLILGYEYTNRTYFGDNMVAGGRLVVAYDDYTDDAGISIEQGGSVILEPSIGVHFTSSRTYHVVNAPGSFRGRQRLCDREEKGELEFSNMFAIQPFIKSGSRDLNGWHLAYEFMLNRKSANGGHDSNSRKMISGSDVSYGVSFKVGDIDEYGSGNGVDIWFALQPAYFEFGIYNYEAGSRLTMSVGARF